MHAFDYALVRAVDVPTGDAVVVGVVLHSRQSRFLGVRLADPPPSCLGLDPALLERAVVGFRRIAHGGAEAGPVGRLPPSERFHFLTATRSTALQSSPVRTGLTDDPEGTLDRIAGGLRPGLR